MRAAVPWSRRASSVCGGSVLTVSGPISVSTYLVSGYAGFFVLVEAQSGRCTRAPAARSSANGSASNTTW